MAERTAASLSKFSHRIINESVRLPSVQKRILTPRHTVSPRFESVYEVIDRLSTRRVSYAAFV